MAATLVQVRFRLAWQTYRVGEVITPNATQRDWLLANGYVELVTDAGERPGKLTGKAAKKIGDVAAGLFKKE
jgi:hypothetical protein